MKCTRNEYTRSYRHSIYGLIAAILSSLTAIGIGMNQAVSGQYYDYRTGTYHTTGNASSINDTSVNMTISDTQTQYSHDVLRESGSGT